MCGPKPAGQAELVLTLFGVLFAAAPTDAQPSPATIQSANSGLYLDANPKTQGNGAQVYLWNFNGMVQQKWRLKPAN
jgi:hypothetical protein